MHSHMYSYESTQQAAYPVYGMSVSVPRAPCRPNTLDQELRYRMTHDLTAHLMTESKSRELVQRENRSLKNQVPTRVVVSRDCRMYTRIDIQPCAHDPMHTRTGAQIHAHTTLQNYNNTWNELLVCFYVHSLFV